MPRCVIDFHVHLIRYETQSPSLDGLMASTYGSMEAFHSFADEYSQPQNFLRMMKNEGVDYAVILAEYAPLTTGIGVGARGAGGASGVQDKVRRSICGTSPGAADCASRFQ